MATGSRNNPTNSGPTASAPYNFVPLPTQVVKAVEHPDDLPSHDASYTLANYPHTGHIVVKVTTLSPLYVRSGLSTHPPGPGQPSEFERAQMERDDDSVRNFRSAIKNKPEFFYTCDPEQPVIPGSTLRGMLRALIEIISYSKVQPVSDKRLFFRTLDNSSLGKAYNQRMVESLGQIQPTPSDPKANGYRARVCAGFFRIRADGSCYIETCDVARIEISDVLKLFGLNRREQLYELDNKPVSSKDLNNPNQTPSWRYQHSQIRVAVDAQEKDYFFPKKFNQKTNKPVHPDFYLRFRKAWPPEDKDGDIAQTGTLVLTGHVPSKHMAFVFLPRKRPDSIDVPNDPEDPDLNHRLVDRFHDNDQITPWQVNAFPPGKPNGAKRLRSGGLRDGEPVFYLIENGTLTFFGRAQMFRLPYRNRPIDLVPSHLRQPEDTDLAEAIFGYVGKSKQAPQGDRRRSYSGRVSVTDAVLVKNYSPEQLWLTGNASKPLTPRILASPKPTAFQHYLEQKSAQKKHLLHYDSSTYIRGHKLYWRKGKRSLQDIQESDPEWLDVSGKVKDESSQHTLLKPVNAGIEFRFTIYFENLSDVELGALQWALTLPGPNDRHYCHALGMGKPLGMGAVKLSVESLHLDSRVDRYARLFDSRSDKTEWHVGSPATKLDFTSDFEKFILRSLPQSETKGAKRLRDVPRIQSLLALMEWRDAFPSLQEREYMSLKKFKQRPVLPNPLQVANRSSATSVPRASPKKQKP